MLPTHGKTLNRASIFALLCALFAAHAPAFAQEVPKDQGGQGREKVSELLRSFSDLKRDSGASVTRMNEGLKKVLVTRMPIIDSSCDITTSHAILQLSFAVLAGEKGSEPLIYDLSEAFVTGGKDAFSALTPKCRGVLKTFGLLVLRTRLGADWEAQTQGATETPPQAPAPLPAPVRPASSPSGRSEK